MILVNGENDAARLKQLSVCDNIAEILATLLSGGFIEQQAEATPAKSPAASAGSEQQPADAVATTASAANDESGKHESANKVSARGFMTNTLLTFANRVRVAKLIDEINAAQDAASLEQLVNPWYQALSETPGGMYQADDLRSQVGQMIAAEGTQNLR